MVWSSSDADWSLCYLVFALRLGRRFRNRAFILHRRSEFAPEEVNRDAGDYDNQSGPGRGCLINKKHSQDHGGTDDVENRNNRIAESFVRPFGIRSLVTQHDDAKNREDIKNQRG